jgi:hypothetical protein
MFTTITTIATLSCTTESIDGCDTFALLRYEDVPQEELERYDDTCAICHSRMENAKRLPCGHIFHQYVVLSTRECGLSSFVLTHLHAYVVLMTVMYRGCILQWIERSPSCPTCRHGLLDPHPPPRIGTTQGEAGVNAAPMAAATEPDNDNHVAAPPPPPETGNQVGQTHQHHRNTTQVFGINNANNNANNNNNPADLSTTNAWLRSWLPSVSVEFVHYDDDDAGAQQPITNEMVCLSRWSRV